MERKLRPESMQRITTPEMAQAFIAEQVKEIRETVGTNRVLLALSGGVDSSVVAALIIKAIGGENLTCVHVNHGMMRKNESENVLKVFRSQMNCDLVYIDATDRYLEALAGVSDSEKKRKIIGGMFIDIFAEEAKKRIGSVKFLAQGTIYPDILESLAGIKPHHNDGGLPEDIKDKFALLEPLQFLYKDEVRIVGRELGLPAGMVDRQPFPGPGLGVRCTGAITRERLDALREADAIVREEIDAAGFGTKIWQYFAVIPDITTTAVRLDAEGKTYGSHDWPVIIRCVNSVDAVTATVPELPWSLLTKITDRILAEVKGVCRVCYELSPKPVSTIEWE